MDPMPGWELTKLWLDDNEMPKKGILQITFSTDPKKGFRANRAFRRSLLFHTLIREQDLILDMPPDLAEKVIAKVPKDFVSSPAVAYMSANTQYWESYLLAKAPGD